MSKIEDGGPAFPVPLNQNEPWSRRCVALLAATTNNDQLLGDSK